MLAGRKIPFGGESSPIHAKNGGSLSRSLSLSLFTFDIVVFVGEDGGAGGDEFARWSESMCVFCWWLWAFLFDNGN